MVLRKEPEGSLLLHALLDLIVDQAVQVVDKYSDKITETETQVLLRPNMNIVRTRGSNSFCFLHQNSHLGPVHILSADISLRKRMIQPLKPMLWGLRKFDLERTAACMGTDQKLLQGYMSPKTKIYLASRQRPHLGECIIDFGP